MPTRKGMSCSEAGKLGNIKSRALQNKLYLERIEKYNADPRLCENCHNPISYESRYNRFCSKKCAAEHNNTGRRLTIQEKYERSIKLGGDGHNYVCFNCGKLRVRLDNPFCSEECRLAYQETHKRVYGNKKSSVGASMHIAGINSAKTRWENRKDDIAKTGSITSNTETGITRNPEAKRYLSEMFGRKCFSCGVSEINGVPVPLEVHHIDGNATNSRIENLQLLCPTCHAMTPTFKNKGARASTRTDRVVLKKNERQIWSLINSDQGGFYAINPAGETDERTLGVSEM